MTSEWKKNYNRQYYRDHLEYFQQYRKEYEKNKQKYNAYRRELYHRKKKPPEKPSHVIQVKVVDTFTF